MEQVNGKFVYTVKQLNREVRNLLEASYRSIWVEGEISGLATPGSGHIYFSLKDENSIIRCAFFRNRRNRNSPVPTEGMQVLLSGQISYYEPRGDLQFIVSYMEEAGEGALRRAFELLKQKLGAEGLFEQEHKAKIPVYPGKIGIITSASGAALQDILVTLNRRYPVADVILYPTLVQGASAPQNIVEAIELADKRRETDVIILARGGGSLEDLQAFNDEMVARKVHQCTIPVVCGVGHEVDFTICDFVSDQRAPTPTAAAEMVTPDILEIVQSFSISREKLIAGISKFIREFQQSVDFLTSRLTHPERKLAQYRSDSQHLEKRLVTYNQINTARLNNSLQKLSGLLFAHSPAARIKLMEQNHRTLQRDLNNQMGFFLGTWQHALSQCRAKIELLSPAHTVDRGYAIVQNRDQEVITGPDQTKPGESLQIRVSRGRLDVVVDEV
jgi:exodeoxyribonuclease VII large subunit